MTSRTPEGLAASLRKGLVIWFLLSLLGIGIVALPDDDARIISFSTGHGPSVVDSAGIVVLLAGWLVFVSTLWRARSGIARPHVLGGLALLGAGVVAWSVATDSGSWWIVGAAVLVIAQVVAAVSAMRRLQDQ